MAYYRTLTSGERRLIYTARDRQKQRQRRALRSDYPVPTLVVVHSVPSDWRYVRRWTRADIEHFWWWHNYHRASMQHSIDHQRQRVREWRLRNLLTLKRERRRITSEEAWSGQATLSLQGYTSSVEASPGYLVLDKLTLHAAQLRLKNMEMALHLYDHQDLVKFVGGPRFDPPYSRLGADFDA